MAKINILEALVRLRDDIKEWTSNNIRLKLNKNLGADHQGKFLAIDEQGEVTPIALEDIQLPEEEFDETNSFGEVNFFATTGEGTTTDIFSAEEPGDALYIKQGDNVTFARETHTFPSGKQVSALTISAPQKEETNSFGQAMFPIDESGKNFVGVSADKPGDDLIFQAGDNVTLSQGLLVDEFGNGKTTVLISATGGGAAAGSVDKLNTPRKIELVGDVTGSAMFDGSKDIQINADVEVKYEDVKGAPDVVENEDGSLSIVDDKGRIAARVGSDGVEASQILTDAIVYQGQRIDTRLFPYVESLGENQTLVTKDGNWIVEDRVTSWDQLEGRPFGSVVSPGILQFDLNWDENSQLYLGKLFNISAINEGQTYNITMPGVLSGQVTKVAKNVANELSTTLFDRYENYLGNIYMALRQGENTGEDFFLLGDLKERTIACFVKKAKTTDRIALNVSITAISDFNTIPEKYLPQTVATTEYVEEYVENNSTKIQFITWERGD